MATWQDAQEGNTRVSEQLLLKRGTEQKEHVSQQDEQSQSKKHQNLSVGAGAFWRVWEEGWDWLQDELQLQGKAAPAHLMMGNWSVGFYFK